MNKLFLIFVALFAALCMQTQVQAQDLPPMRPPLPPTLPALDDFPTGGRMLADRRGFYMDGEPITVRQAKDYAWPYRKALKHIRRGQGWNVSALTLASLGGGFIGIDIGNTITGEEVAGAGTVLGLLLWGGAFGLEAIAISQFRKAADDYNTATGLVCVPELTPCLAPELAPCLAPDHEITLALGPTPGGVGLQLTF
jgi:hypothetical protein